MRIALLLVLLWFASSASAQGTDIVLLAPGDSVLAKRVAAELRALGFVVIDGEAAAQAAQAQESLPVLQIDTAPGAVLVYLYGAGLGEHREQLAIDAQASEAALAIRIVEFARAAVWARPPPEPAAQTQSTPVEAPATSPPVPARVEIFELPSAPVAQQAKAAIELGFAALGSPGGLGVNYGLTLFAGGFVAPWLRLGVSAYAPLNALTQHASEGTSRSRVALVAAELRAEFRAAAALRPSVGGGIGAAILATEGRPASSMYTAVNRRAASAGAHLCAGLAYHFAKSFSLRLDVAVGAQLSRFVIAYGQREGGRWGLPWFLGALAAEFRIH